MNKPKRSIGVEIIENFFKIRAEKQEHIIKAALSVFGRQGYRKASLSDIAKEAGITKGMITYYFGSKKNLYLYLLELTQTSYEEELKERLKPGITDLLERLKIMTDLQMTIIKKYPAAVSFAKKVYYETDPEVLQNIEQVSAAGYAQINERLFKGVGFSGLKPELDSRLVSKFVVWAYDGFFEEIFWDSSLDRLEEHAAEFYQCLELVRHVFYSKEQKTKGKEQRKKRKK